MIRKCLCGKYPSFGYSKDKKRICCASCKKDGMINLKSKKCSCGKQPSFGFPGDKQATCCSNCKKDEMIDIISKRCPCRKRPIFGYPDDKKAICCVNCKKDGMVDVKHKKCSCGKSPYFGFPGDKKPTCCASCKKEKMINIRDKKCSCGKSPYFGFPGDKKPTYCASCKKDGMINIKGKKCPCGSRKVPIYGFIEDKQATCCSNCKKDGMENIINKKCKANECGIMCPTWANPYYDGFCTHCFAHLFPNHSKTANIRKKSKELRVVHHISSKYEGFLHDKPLYVNLQGGCCPSKRRIDLRKLIGNTLLCIEIDENQHRGYCPKNEETRYNDLFMDFSSKYIFIRYNPDKYTDDKGKKRNPKFETRIKVLEKEIEKHMLRIEQEENKELLEIHHLFFDSI
jgi:hypothetical protein